jgi:pyruvate,water dikinase
MSEFVLPFDAVTISDIDRVGGKCASLGEMRKHLAAEGIRVPDGFCVTTAAYWDFLRSSGLDARIDEALRQLRADLSNLHEVGGQIRDAILEVSFSPNLEQAITEAYEALVGEGEPGVAIRSSATAEDLDEASFAGQQESFLNVRGVENVIEACHKCFASLFTDRAIQYRVQQGVEHMQVGLAVGVQRMVRSDLASSGVGFTIDPDSGFDQVLLITGSLGLGEMIVQGAVTPDEHIIYKPALRDGRARSIINRKLGTKLEKMIFARHNSGSPVRIVKTSKDEQAHFVLSDSEIEYLGRWLIRIEEHYGKPMDVEWAKDGVTGELFIVQARPETVRSQQQSPRVREYTVKGEGTILLEGIGIGNKAVVGKARILRSPKESSKLKEGEILITDITSPDWDPVLKRAGAIITNKGGRTSHAAIVARELGALAIVGTGNATDTIAEGTEITVFSDNTGKGYVYEGALECTMTERELGDMRVPRTKPMFILADPDQAFKFSRYPNEGVGLLRLEFIINNWVKAHPMALVKFDELKDKEDRRQIEALTQGCLDKREYFVRKLAEGVATIAAAFYPKDVIVRMSDFKTNEYANLVGGKQFEPHEENPMLGWRGASRYYHPNYRDGFALECASMKMVRDEMGFTNVKLMIPFCRTPQEGREVIALMRKNGLVQGENALEIYVMAELPSNVILAEDFAEIFDGFSIGSNDLTQLTLGVDRDSGIVTEIFDETTGAPREMIGTVIDKARKAGRKIGLCGQAASDHPEFARFLVERGIDSISFNPDAIFKGIENILAVEDEIAKSNTLKASQSELPTEEPRIEVFWTNGDRYSRMPTSVQ